MRRTKAVIAVIVFLLLSLGAYAQQKPVPIDIGGDILKPHPWTVAELKQQFAKEVQAVKFTGTDKAQHTGTGIPLISLLLASAPKAETNPKHYDLSFFVIIEARDNYHVYFSLAELQPLCGNAQAWLVWDVDGKALMDKEAPLRLTVLSDKDPDRWIWGIAKITLVDGTKLAAKLSGGK